MKLPFVILLLFIISISACKEEEIKPLLSDEEMVAILTDIHLAEAAILSLNRKLKDSVSQVYYKQIFEIHEVKDSVFYNEFEILRKQPKKVKELYGKVGKRIDELQLNKSKEKSTKKKK